MRDRDKKKKKEIEEMKIIQVLIVSVLERGSNAWYRVNTDNNIVL